jgi:hypothetical protein
MEPTSNQPNNGYAGSGNPTHSDSSSASHGADNQFSTTAAHATGSGHFPADYAAPTQPDSGTGVKDKLNDAVTTGKEKLNDAVATSKEKLNDVVATGKDKLNDAVASGKKWLNDSGVADKAQQLPQAAKDLGNKAVQSVNGLTTTQKAVGVGLLAAGVAFLLTRSKRDKSDDGEYRHRPRRSPFDHQPHTRDNSGFESRGQRPWGGSRYASGPQGAVNKPRVSSGSGYTSGPAHSNDFGSQTGTGHQASSIGNQRRDQGPASGSRYDARTSGSQNPNNLDQLNSAF